jgi:[ribosomal protein S5]-alanine N-acetyltransferase
VPVPVLKSQRLTLRQIVAEDAPALHHALSDAVLMTWWSSGPHQTLAETEAYVRRNAEENAGFQCWAITHEGDEALGWVVLIEKRPQVQEVGYILRRDQWGHGFAREAVARVIDYAFVGSGARRIFADTDPDNQASIKLVKSLGFRLEGHLRGEWETHIGVRDSLIFGLLREEWEAENIQGHD